MIQRRPPGDREQPVDNAAFAVNAMDVLERLDERLLREVLRVLALPRHLVEEIQHPPMMQMHELLEGTRVTTRGSAHDFRLVAASRGRTRRGRVGVGRG
jgi:hypothetical protein